MYVVINGGGKVGSYLGHTLVSKGHSVAVIERRPQVLEKLAQELPTEVLLIEGDGCEVRFQEDAGVEHADVFAAVTGNDDDNLVSCQLAKLRFRVNRAVARINSPKNERIFHALGIEGVSSTIAISRQIEEEMTFGEISTLYTLHQGRLTLVKMDIPQEQCAMCSKKVAELGLPADTVLVTVIRGENVIVPKGDTVMEPGDRLIAVTTFEHKEDLRRLLEAR
jgi:trk system potassium uptake protein